MVTAKFSAIPNHSCTPISLIFRYNRMVPSSKAGSFLAVRTHGSCYFLILESHPFFIEALLMRSSPAPVFKRQVCGWIWCKLISISMGTLYVDFGRSVTKDGSTSKVNSSANIADDGPWDLKQVSLRLGTSNLSGNNSYSCLILVEASASVDR